ncbi:MAG: hypothetical protein ACM3O4_00345 [Ignavibacteriales bacterium]
MKEHDIFLNEVITLPKVGESNEAEIFQFSKDKVLKIYHTPKAFLERKILLLSEMQPLIKNTHLPLGRVYFKDEFIGCVHIYHRNSVNFESLINSPDHSYRIDKFKQLNDNINELILNNIYYDDLDSENVLITPNNKVELIDTDSAFISTNQSKNNKRKKEIYNQLKSMIIECLFDEEYFFNDKEVLSRYKVKNEYIDQITSSNLSYEFFDELFNYLEKDKVLTLK